MIVTIPSLTISNLQRSKFINNLNFKIVIDDVDIVYIIYFNVRGENDEQI